MASPTKSAVRTRRLVTAALLACMAMALQYLESLLPPLVPGLPVRLGLANIFVLYALMHNKKPDALAISLLRCLLVPIFSGAVSGLLYALPGALLSYAGMLLLLPLYQRERIGAVGLSVFGAFLYNAAQLGVGCFTIGSAMLLYAPWMGLLSIPAGICTGLIAAMLKTRIPSSFLS